MSTQLVQLNRCAIICSGSRDWTDLAAIRARLITYPGDTIVLHGGARGADSLVEQACREYQMQPVSHPFFRERGNAGGPIRNALLVKLLTIYQSYGYQTAVEIFKLNGAENVGTENLQERTEKAGFITVVTMGEA